MCEPITERKTKDYVGDSENQFIKYAKKQRNKMNDIDLMHLERFLDKEVELLVFHGLGKLHEEDFNLTPCVLVASLVKTLHTV